MRTAWRFITGPIVATWGFYRWLTDPTKGKR